MNFQEWEVRQIEGNLLLTSINGSKIFCPFEVQNWQNFDIDQRVKLDFKMFPNTKDGFSSNQ